MAWAISSALQRAYSEASCQPTALAVIQLQPTARIRINDSAAIAGSGATITFEIRAEFTLTEGVDWDSSGSIATTAQSLYEAIVEATDQYAVTVNASVGPTRVTFGWFEKRRSSFSPGALSTLVVTTSADPSDLAIVTDGLAFAFLTVLDPAALNGATVTISFRETFDAVEGVDFDAGVSPSECAGNLGAAYQAAGAALDWEVPLRYYVDTTASGAAWLTLIWIEDPLPSNTLSSRVDITSGDAPGGSITAYDNSLVPMLRLAYADRPLGSPSAPALLSKISGLEDKHDPITREPMLDGFEIGVILDDEMTAVFQRYVLKRRRCRLYIGELHVDGDDVTIDPTAEGFTNYFAWPMGYIDRVQKMSNREATLKVMPRLLDAKDAQVIRRFTNVHPLEAFLEIARMASVDVGDFYPSDPDIDTTSIDPSQAQWDPVGHYVVSRYDDQVNGISSGIDQPTPALDILNSLLILINATLSFAPGTGRATLAAFDPTGASIATLTERASTAEVTYPVQIDGDIDDVYDGSAPTVEVSYGQDRTSGAGKATYSETDRAAELELGGRGGRVTIDTDWCNALANVVRSGIEDDTLILRSAILENALSYIVNIAPRVGFCGSRSDGTSSIDSFSIPAWAQLSTSKRAFHRIEGPDRYNTVSTIQNEDGPECVALWQSVLLQDDGHGLHSAPDTIAVTTEAFQSPFRRFPLSMRYRIDPTYLLEGFSFGRGGLGTTTPYQWYNLGDATGLKITDITIPKAIAQRVLARVRLGMPKVMIRGQLDLVQFRPGDIVQLVTDRFIGPLVGRPESLRIYFEVIRNVFRGFDGDPCCQLELAYLRAESSVQQVTSIPFYTPTTIVNVAAPNDVVTNDGIPVYADTDGDLVADDQVTVG